jgi:hypothetical protein
MTNLIRIARSLYLAVGLTLGFAACASDPVEDPANPMDPLPPDPQAVQRIESNLERLRDLQVFQVGEIVIDGEETEVVAATELEAFAGTAENACAAVEADPAACTTEAIEANLAALRDLSVVEVGDLLVVEPANNPNCYNLPCQEDEEAAAAETCARATKLARILQATESQY